MVGSLTADQKFAVALSFPGSQRAFVNAVALELAGHLGKDRIFYDQWYDHELATFDLLNRLQKIYGTQSQLVVPFICPDYESSQWARQEWLAIQALHKEGLNDIMPVALGDPNITGMLSTFGYLDVQANNYTPRDVAERIVKRLDTISIPNSRADRAVISETPNLTLQKPSILRFLLDRFAPGIHRLLTFRLSYFEEPPETQTLTGYLSILKTSIEREIAHQLYVPSEAKQFSGQAEFSDGDNDPFQRPVAQRIRQILGRAKGGDAASAQVAAMSRKSKAVGDIRRSVMNSAAPMVLLGDPGTGKTMTLRMAVRSISQQEECRVFPRIVIYIRLGEFHGGEVVGVRDVFRFIETKCDPTIRPWLHALAGAGRLTVCFDGMDEMSREYYTEHTAVLSDFAKAYRNRVKTLFSCRITDFSPKFDHERIVLLPFERRQISAYLLRSGIQFPLTIDSRNWSLKQLAKRLAGDVSGLDARCPFHLYLICFFLREQKSWPLTRVDLLKFHQTKTYERKQRDAASQDPLPEYEEIHAHWAHLAFFITERNLGTSLPVSELPFDESINAEIVRVGVQCGVLRESIPEWAGDSHLIRFDHHRLQEFYAAVHIHELQPEIDWLSRLDTPRWQETMFNVILMGTSNAPVDALAKAIENSVCRLSGCTGEQLDRLLSDEDSIGRKELWQEHLLRNRIEPVAESSLENVLPPDDVCDENGNLVSHQLRTAFAERQLANRLELGCRIASKTKSAKGSDQSNLVLWLERAAGYLAKHGNPTSQIKAARAALNVPQIDTLSILRTPLNSKVAWTREQALILTAGRGGSIGVNFRLEAATAFAENNFAPRLFSFIKAAWSSRRVANYLAIIGLILCVAAQVCLVSAAGAGLFSVIRTHGLNYAISINRESISTKLVETESGEDQADEQVLARLAARLDKLKIDSPELPTKLRTTDVATITEHLNNIERCHKVQIWASRLPLQYVFAGLLSISIILHLLNYGSDAWLFCSCAVTLLIAGFFSFSALAEGLPWDASLLLLGALFCGIPIGILLGLVQLVVHAAGQLAFSLCSRAGIRRMMQSWNLIKANYEDLFILLHLTLTLALSLLPFFVLAVVLDFLILLLNQLTDYLNVDIRLLVFVIMAVIFAVFLGRPVLKLRAVDWRKIAGDLLSGFETIFEISIAVIFFLPWIAALIFAGGMILSGLDFTFRLLGTSDSIGYVVFVLLFVAMIFLSFKGVRRIIAQARSEILLPMLTLRRKIPDTTIDWKNELSSANTRRQAYLIRQSTNSHFGVSSLDFFSLLVDVESKVCAGPAKDAYWSKRNEVEEILRQERNE